MKIEVFRSGLLVQRWYFRVRAGNGQVIAQSEGYSRRIDCIGTAHSLKNGIGKAEIVEC